MTKVRIFALDQGPTRHFGRKGTFTAVAIALMLAGAASAQIKPANAGTGPYMPMLLWDSGGSSDPGYRIQTELAFLVASLKSKVRDLRMRQFDIDRVEALAEKGGLKEEFDPLRIVLASYATQPPSAINCAIDTFMKEVCAAAYESFLAHPESQFGSKASVIKWGALLARTASYEFQTLTHSPGESGGRSDGQGTRRAPFVTASALVPAYGAGQDPTGRVGAGILIGNPESWVAGFGAATFFSPNALDVEANLTYRLAGIDDAKSGSPVTVAELDRKVRPRILADHVRAKDIWLSAGARRLSYPGSGPGQDATIYDIALTYAFPDRIHALGTTLTVSRIECARRTAQVDEWGAEFRWPTTGGEQPTYFSARYGTRGQYTLAFEARF